MSSGRPRSTARGLIAVLSALGLAGPCLGGCAGDGPSGPGGASGAPVASGASLAVGTLSSCALASDSTAYCWGMNGLGTLGNPAVPGDTWVPVQVRGARHYAALALNATNQVSGPFTACALTADGAADCWGSDPDGLLGPPEAAPCVDSAATPRTTGPCLHAPTRVAPALRFRRLSVGWAHICGVTADDAVVCWGRGTEGQLGTGTAVSTTTPTAVPMPAGAAKVVDVVASDKFTCALDATGAAYCWGLNTYGQLGDGTTQTRLTPVRVQTTAILTRLHAGSDHACAVTQGGAALCWGDAFLRRLGTDGPFPPGAGTASAAPVPVTVPLGAPTGAVSAAAGGGCAIDTAGRLRCWGTNVYGEAGTTDTAGCQGTGDRMACLPQDVSPSVRFAEVSAGVIHACARAVDRAVYCWGNNFHLMVGSRVYTNRIPTPVRVPVP